ncbi:MAG: hypothetical protein K6G08_02170, partial [Prevotella sp.]|nr:hypothetical protein [Prevotella sp.]
IGPEISGTSYDVAHVRWSGSWQMPTNTQFEELLNNCSSEYISWNRVNGLKLTGANGNSIFLPATGYYGVVPDLQNETGNYYSSTRDNTRWAAAYVLTFGVDYQEIEVGGCSTGFSVRPICQD